MSAVECFRVVGKAVCMAMLTGQQTGTAGTTQRVGNETVGKTDSLFGDAVDVRSLDEPMIIRTDCLKRMIIAHNVEDIHWLLSLLCPCFFLFAGRQRC